MCINQDSITVQYVNDRTIVWIESSALCSGIQRALVTKVSLAITIRIKLHVSVHRPQPTIQIERQETHIFQD